MERNPRSLVPATPRILTLALSATVRVTNPPTLSLFRTTWSDCQKVATGRPNLTHSAQVIYIAFRTFAGYGAVDPEFAYAKLSAKAE